MIKKVLCVDDDMVTLAIFKRILSKAQTIEKIETALNGQEALDLLLNMQQHQITLPDIILLDLNMPEFEAFRVDIVNVPDKYYNQSSFHHVFLDIS